MKRIVLLLMSVILFSGCNIYREVDDFKPVNLTYENGFIIVSIEVFNYYNRTIFVEADCEDMKGNLYFDKTYKYILPKTSKKIELINRNFSKNNLSDAHNVVCFVKHSREDVIDIYKY